MITLRSGLWHQILQQFIEHGAARTECVVYLTAPQNTPGLVDSFEHPEHTATPTHYAPLQPWLAAFFASLVAEGRTVVAQVHTHRGLACHSDTDDRYPLVRTPGYLSLVVPHFARPPQTVDALFLVEVDQMGHWQEVEVRDRFHGIVEE